MVRTPFTIDSQARAEEASIKGKMAEYQRVEESSAEMPLSPPPPPPKKSEIARPPSISRLPSFPSEVQYEDPKKAKSIIKKLDSPDAKKNQNSLVTNGKPHQEVKRVKSEVNKKKKPVFYKITEPKPRAPVQSQPTIIRSGVTHGKKKKPPPRPPPPKFKSFNRNSAQGPPSYEDVVQADIDAFLGEMSAPRPTPQVPIRPRPPVPQQARAYSLPQLAPPSVHSQRPPKPLPRMNSQPASSSAVLIDFDAPLTNPPFHSNPSEPVRSQSLLDLDVIFSMNEMPDGPSQTHLSSSNLDQGWNSEVSATKLNLGPRLLPPGPVPSLQHKSRNQTAEEKLSSSGLKNGSHIPGGSRGEDWLLSCLKNTINGEIIDACTSSNAIYPNTQSFDQPGSNEWYASSPPLPPRPKSYDLLASDFAMPDGKDLKRSLAPPPLALPPPVPPLPLASLEGNLNVEADPPPLPPRPTRFETRPHAIAVYDYTALQSDELSFKANEIITLIHYVNSEWLYGCTDQAEGMFPKNYIRIIIPLPGHEQYQNETSRPCCKALYDFEGENDQELTFSAGDIIALESRENEWFRGIINGKTGMFPVSFVEIVEDLHTNDTNNGIAKPSCSTKNNCCIAIYDFMGEEGELSFREGEKIIITEEINADWMKGKLKNGLEGRFPKAFVVPVI